MPELPEVETIRRELEAVMPGASINRVDVRLPKIVKVPTVRFRRVLHGATIEAVRRRAKVLLIQLSNGYTVIIHLKMSGQLIWVPRCGRMKVGGHPIPGGIYDLPNQYSHVIFHTNHGVLYFNDQRQFGYNRLIKTSALAEWLETQGYGPEPLEADFTVGNFLDILVRHRRKRIKPTLLDQTVIAGVGNIYADEACFAARVRPSRRIQTMTVAERRAVYRGLRAIMILSIKKRGTTADAYRTATGDKGGMMPFLKVYGREGKSCRRCRGIIKKTVLAGRGTHYCSSCQR